MPVTRDQYHAVVDMWRWWNWTPRMIAVHFNMKPWETEAIIEREERRQSATRKTAAEAAE